MSLFLLYGVGTPFALLLILQLALRGENPFHVVASTGRTLQRTGLMRLLIGLLVLVNLFNFVESPLDAQLSRWLGYDFTGWVHSIEGDWVGRMQAQLPASLFVWLALVYLPGWIALQLAALFVLAHRGEERGLAAFLLGISVNYLLALPFYLFFPVKEVAWSGLSSAQPMLERLWPGISAQMHFGSALDNCFPSLHVSCAVTTLWFAHRHGTRGLRIVAWVLTLTVGAAVLALGIHWLLDAIAGVPYGIACAWMGERIVEPVLGRLEVPGALPAGVGAEAGP